jgi:hypothetical protein
MCHHWHGPDARPINVQYFRFPLWMAAIPQEELNITYVST